MADLVLHHCPQTRSGTALWMNEEAGAPARVQLVDLKAGAHKEPAFLAKNPMGKVPMLTTGDVAVTESAAICAYLAEYAPAAGLAPAPGDPARGSYFRWLFFGPSVIEPMMLDRLGKVVRANPASAGHGAPEAVLATLRQALSGRNYLVGDRFSAADAVVGGTLRFAMMFGAIEKEPLFEAYVDRLMSRPAAKSAEKKDAEFLASMAPAS